MLKGSLGELIVRVTWGHRRQFGGAGVQVMRLLWGIERRWELFLSKGLEGSGELSRRSDGVLKGVRWVLETARRGAEEQDQGGIGNTGQELE